jgi:hypothetical protein
MGGTAAEKTYSTIDVLNLYSDSTLILNINNQPNNCTNNDFTLTSAEHGSDLKLSYISRNCSSTFEYDLTNLTFEDYALSIFAGKLIDDDQRYQAAITKWLDHKYIDRYVIDNIEHVGEYNTYSDDTSIIIGSVNLFVLLVSHDDKQQAELLLPVDNDKKQTVIDQIHSAGAFITVIPLTTKNNVIIYNMFNDNIQLISQDSVTYNIFNYDGFSSVENGCYPTFYFDIHDLNFNWLGSDKTVTTGDLGQDKKYVFVVFAGTISASDKFFDPLTDLNKQIVHVGNSLLLAIFAESGSTEAEYRTFFTATVLKRSNMLINALVKVVAFE